MKKQETTESGEVAHGDSSMETTKVGLYDRCFQGVKQPLEMAVYMPN